MDLEYLKTVQYNEKDENFFPNERLGDNFFEISFKEELDVPKFDKDLVYPNTFRSEAYGRLYMNGTVTMDVVTNNDVSSSLETVERTTYKLSKEATKVFAERLFEAIDKEIDYYLKSDDKEVGETALKQFTEAKKNFEDKLKGDFYKDTYIILEENSIDVEQEIDR